MRCSFLFVAFVLISLPAPAAEYKNIGLGVDFSLPFTLLVDGKGNSGRENLNLGADFRHWFTETQNWGLRFGFDLDRHNGLFRKLGLAPGYAHHWLVHENWRPFLRFDAPFLLRGALNNKGAKDQKDLGIGGGAGFVWKLGDAVGLDDLEFRYDFDFHYYFGIGDAVTVVGMDLFRFGFEYRF